MCADAHAATCRAHPDTFGACVLQVDVPVMYDGAKLSEVLERLGTACSGMKDVKAQLNAQQTKAKVRMAARLPTRRSPPP